MYLLLERDRVPTYLVSEWDAVCTMWDGDAISGPVPTLYADNIEVANYSAARIEMFDFCI
jgi:hypothetical protein